MLDEERFVVGDAQPLDGVDGRTLGDSEPVRGRGDGSVISPPRSLVSWDRPMSDISSVNDVSWLSSRSILRAETKVPLPRVLVIAPSRTSSSRARLTVTREQSKALASSFSVGSRSPAERSPDSSRVRSAR
nr:hypothetical protein [Actinomyces ruminis]